MADWVYYILAALGLLVFGVGGGGLFANRKGRSKLPAVIPPAPVPHVPVGPSETEVENADAAAVELDAKIARIEEVEAHVEDTKPSPTEPDKEVVKWLFQKK